MNHASTQRCFEDLMKVCKKNKRFLTALKIIVQKYGSRIPTTTSFICIIIAVSVDNERYCGEVACLSKYEQCVHAHRTEKRDSNKTLLLRSVLVFSTFAATLQWTLPTKKSPGRCSVRFIKHNYAVIYIRVWITDILGWTTSLHVKMKCNSNYLILSCSLQ
jgi:hypothetical protein